VNEKRYSRFTYHVLKRQVTMTRKITISIIAIILLFVAVMPGYAQGQNPITATVDRVTLSTDETLTLSVTVNTNLNNPPQPVIPSLAGFNVLGTSTSSQISIINGALSSMLVYNYRLQPTQPGDLVIDPVSLTVNGQTYTTPPITIQVTQGTGATAAAPSAQPATPADTEFRGQDVFAEAVVSNPNPYLGEQVTYTVRLYRVADAFDMFDQPYFEPPAFTGFWSEGDPAQNQYRGQAGGRIYNVTELSTTLFPTKVGQLTIEPAQITIPGGFFHAGKRLQTQPVTLDVKPLPPYAPAGFNGAVGQFTIDTSVDTNQSKVNEPVTWQVTLTGYGNLKGLPEPNWPEMADWRSFQSQATVNTQSQNGQPVGSVLYERLLVPQQPGRYTIPALEYSTFDPAAGEYRTLTTEPIPVDIAPGDGLVTQNIAPAINDDQRIVEQVGTDIRHLKPVPAELRFGTQAVTNSPLYWLAWGVPLVGLVGHIVWKRRARYWQNNGHLVRSSQARKKARQALARARKGDQNSYGAAGQILSDYLADKLDQPVAGLTHQALAELLTARGVPADLTERIQDCLATGELGQYAPSADYPAHAENLLNEVNRVIRDLEKVL
jgi:hypothetical protein